MSRRRKTFEVLRDDRTERSVTIYYLPDGSTLGYGDPAPGLFEAVIGGMNVRTPNIQEIRAAALKWLGETADLKWLDVIEIKMQQPYFRDEGQGFGFTLDRYWVTTSRVNGRYLKAIRRDETPWHWDTEADKKRRAEWQTDAQKFKDASDFVNWREKHGATRDFSPPCSEEDGEHVWLPYTAETWAALKDMLDQIAKAQKAMARFLPTAKSLTALEGRGREILRMLPKPKQDDQ